MGTSKGLAQVVVVVCVMSKTDEKVMMALRARARRSVQSVFAAIALGSLVFAVYVHLSPGFAGLNREEASALAQAFLFLGTANALTMWAWDYLFWHDLDQ